MSPELPSYVGPPSVPCCRHELSSSPMISPQMSSSTIWPKSSPHSDNADEKYEDWIQISPPPEDDRSAEAVPASAKGDACLKILGQRVAGC
jgi:hypothetical protein